MLDATDGAPEDLEHGYTYWGTGADLAHANRPSPPKPGTTPSRLAVVSDNNRIAILTGYVGIIDRIKENCERIVRLRGNINTSEISGICFTDPDVYDQIDLSIRIALRDCAIIRSINPDELKKTLSTEDDDFTDDLRGLCHDIQSPLRAVSGFLTAITEEPEEDELYARLFATFNRLDRSKIRFEKLFNPKATLPYLVSKLKMDVNSSIETFLKNENLAIDGRNDTRTRIIKLTPPTVYLPLEPKIELDYEFDGASDVYSDLKELRVHFNSVNFGRILQVMVCNAIDKGATKVRVSVHEEADFVRIDIQNDGNPIPEKHVHELFDKGFTKHSKEDPVRFGGKGLGLHSVDRLMRYMGGEVGAVDAAVPESEGGLGGPKFRFYFKKAIPIPTTPPVA